MNRYYCTFTHCAALGRTAVSTLFRDVLFFSLWRRSAADTILCLGGEKATFICLKGGLGVCVCVCVSFSRFLQRA